MRIPLESSTWPQAGGQVWRRQDPSANQTDTKKGDDGSGPSNQSRTLIIIGIVVVITFAFLVGFYLYIKTLRVKHPNPKYVPGNWLKEKWRQWQPHSKKGSYNRSLQRHRRNRDSGASHLIPRESHGSIDNERELPDLSNTGGAENVTATTANNSNGAATVDRNTSVRSVMTLPAYSAMARPTEQILGREGERAGIDVVIEFPETAEEEEGRREDEMESLYQIRVARRQEHAEREERRRLRREARARGDWEALDALRRESRQRAASSATTASAAADAARVSDQLIAEHQTKDRSRRVSSVAYAELGVAKHDGTRVRANSTESDNRPLLDSAASMAGTANSRPGSSRTLNPHFRAHSNTSVLSFSSMATDDTHDHRPSLGPRTGSSGNTDFEIISLTHTHSNDRSRASSVSRNVLTPALTQDGDLGDARIPLTEPPQYDNLGWEEAPPYESPVNTRRPELPAPSGSYSSSSGGRLVAPRLPSLEHLPAIEVTASITPVEESSGASFRRR